MAAATLAIQIRRAEISDAEAICATFCGPRAVAGTMQIPYSSVEAWQKRIAETAAGDHVLVACIDGRVIGSAGLHLAGKSPRRRHAGYLGVAVHDDWQGKGVGTALLKAALDLADNWLNYSRVELSVYVDNEAAIGLYKKYGFVIEGTCKAYAFRDGEYVDAYLMARLKDTAH